MENPDKATFAIKIRDIYKTYIMGKIQSDWIKTEALITNIKKCLDNKFMISYSYEIDGIPYASEQLIENQSVNIIQLAIKMHDIQPIDIYYNPYNLAESCIQKTCNYDYVTYIVIFLIIGSLIILNPINASKPAILIWGLFAIIILLVSVYYPNKK